MKKILVIGSEGYLGSRLVPFLNSKGYNCHELDNFYYGFKEPIIHGDYNDFSEEFYSDYTTIILLAGHSSPSLCENDVQGSYRNNVSNFIKLIKKLNKSHRLLYASSASVCNGLTNASEETELNYPISQYDMQKQIIERVAQYSKVTRSAFGLE